MPKSAPQDRSSLPKRFQSSKKVLIIDQFMTQFIKIGGIGLIMAVSGIFVFILFQILPLFQGAKVSKINSVSLNQKNIIGIGIDEWGEKPFAYNAKGEVFFSDIKNRGKLSKLKLPLNKDASADVIKYDEDAEVFIMGLKGGSFKLVSLLFEPEYNKDQREITFSLEKKVENSFFDEEIDQYSQYRIQDIDYASSDQMIVGAIAYDMSPVDESLASDTDHKILFVTLEESTSLISDGEIEIGDYFQIDDFPGIPDKISIGQLGDVILISNTKGEVFYYNFDGDEIILKQKFIPFADFKPASIRSMDFLSGGTSAYLTHESGENRIFSIYLDPVKEERVFGQTKTFPKLQTELTAFSKSLQNKAILVGAGNWASLRYMTTEDIRWQASVPFQISASALTKKYHKILFLDDKANFHLFQLDDPHPEGGVKAFFTKIWYEGFNEPKYMWQSTGGTDSFEPKLSMIPLIIGTLKGTFYAMLFAIPLALLAGIYSSEFLDQRLKKIVKPMMELMASLPSVILGFLAALWLAPLIEDKVPSVLMTVISIPMIAVTIGFVWSRLPIEYRSWLPGGYEWLVMIPFIILSVFLAWNFGGYLESNFFTVVDPHSGQMISDFRLWWPEVTHTPFEQRNSLVVGFIMGFAVIPIIFTITDDSLSMVPRALRSASLACGASRWQTVFYIVLPTAAAGIFSGCMIGLGRAVGETMIVLMATGNTPIMEWNIFSGMRTLSANLAVELPEAPFHGTLYRTLYLGAFILFVITFIVNTLAEVLRQYLRNKYKTI